MQARRLTDDEPIPAGVPKRFKTRDGYWLLRWRVGVKSYVEALEHRVIAGRDHAHVHHINGDRLDNRPENLKPLTARAHRMEHATLDYAEAAGLYIDGWSLPRLAERYGVNNATLFRGLRTRGVKMRTAREAWQIRKAAKAK